MSAWADIDERDDHYLGLTGANVVATESLLMLQDNLVDVMAAGTADGLVDSSCLGFSGRVSGL
ncbi:hypothetical protein RCH16_003540 [Cryobacterium sp. MP_M5]|nr:hypothetical protein [Cryobacterium sp. MP_M3]MEC5178501.1 hypothetical protein [Cryobacterium sp. MP_M5]